MKTIYCYDRFGTVKRLAGLIALAVVVGGGAALWDVQAHGKSRIVEVAQQPAVLVISQHLGGDKVETLPRVVIEGRRSVEPTADERVALGQGMTPVR